MDDQNIMKVLSLFDSMEDCEKAMSEYYLACSTLTADHYEFCVGLSEEEKDHVTVIKKIKQIFLKILPALIFSITLILPPWRDSVPVSKKRPERSKAARSR